MKHLFIIIYFLLASCSHHVYVISEGESVTGKSLSFFEQPLLSDGFLLINYCKKEAPSHGVILSAAKNKDSYLISLQINYSTTTSLVIEQLAWQDYSYYNSYINN